MEDNYMYIDLDFYKTNKDAIDDSKNGCFDCIAINSKKYKVLPCHNKQTFDNTFKKIKSKIDCTGYIHKESELKKEAGK